MVWGHQFCYGRLPTQGHRYKVWLWYHMLLILSRTTAQALFQLVRLRLHLHIIYIQNSVRPKSVSCNACRSDNIPLWFDMVTAISWSMNWSLGAIYRFQPPHHLSSNDWTDRFGRRSKFEWLSSIDIKMILLPVISAVQVRILQRSHVSHASLKHKQTFPYYLQAKMHGSHCSNYYVVLVRIYTIIIIIFEQNIISVPLLLDHIIIIYDMKSTINGKHIVSDSSDISVGRWVVELP